MSDKYSIPLTLQEFGVLTASEQRLLAYLQEFLTPERRERFEEVLARRTRHLALVLENVYQPLNSSAVLRTCEAVGVQDVHVIEAGNRFRVDRQIALGADGWLSVHRYHAADDPAAACVRQLQGDGYRIVVTSPHATAVTIDELSVDRKLALVIGHEKDGVSADIDRVADERVAIPMWGFTESLNLSVAAALCLYRLRERLDASKIDWRLSPDEQDRLRLDWTRKSINHVEMIEAEYARERSTATRKSMHH